MGEKKVDELDIRPNDDSSLHTFNYRGTGVTVFRKKGETLTVGWSRTPMVLEEMVPRIGHYILFLL